jgi:hypothetical protein
MSLDNLIPQLWAARLLDNLNKTLVYGQPGCANRDYEGEITQAGDTVHINAIGPITVADYTKNTAIGDPEVLAATLTTLDIDQAKYFNFQIDDIDRAQSNPDAMDAAMREAAYALAEEADTYLAGLHVDADAANLLGDDTAPMTDLATEGAPYGYLVLLDVLLTEANVPRQGRFVVVPPWYYGLLLQDNRFVGSGTRLSDRALRNGEIGMAAGFTVLESNNVPNTAGAKFKIIAGHASAITYAEQIVKIEAYRPEKRFADAIKGLHVYGAKLVRPTALAVLTANRPA